MDTPRSSSPSTTIYVGNIQSIKDDQLRSYFADFGRIEAFYHNGTGTADEWLIDYRFIRFSSDTDMSALLSNKIDHIICRIRLDIHPHQAAFADDTRLMLDRKICIAHTNIKLDRNVVKKAFGKYGRILNCTCVSSGKEEQYVYIEFESVNSVASVLASKQRHFAGSTALVVKRALRPSQLPVKTEPLAVADRQPAIQRRNGTFDTTPADDQQSHSVSQYPVGRLTASFGNGDHTLAATDDDSAHPCSPPAWHAFEHEYDVIIQRDLDEITYQTNKFLEKQSQAYRQIRRYLLAELRLLTSSSSSSSSSSESENSPTSPRKRPRDD